MLFGFAVNSGSRRVCFASRLYSNEGSSFETQIRECVFRAWVVIPHVRRLYIIDYTSYYFTHFNYCVFLGLTLHVRVVRIIFIRSGYVGRRSCFYKER